MCLAVPARIVELTGDNAVVEISGVRRSANVAFIENPKVGDYVLLHAGFAIQKWSEEDVREYREIVGDMASLDSLGAES
jgi:hydrogenase expression/formation protein HypC